MKPLHRSALVILVALFVATLGFAGSAAAEQPTAACDLSVDALVAQDIQPIQTDAEATELGDSETLQFLQSAPAPGQDNACWGSCDCFGNCWCSGPASCCSNLCRDCFATSC